jgi:hypothetical protein
VTGPLNQSGAVSAGRAARRLLVVLGLLAAAGALTPPVSATWQSSQSGGP